MLLHVEGLSCAYGRIPALHEVSIEVRTGRIVALVGSNGAGKTTLLRTLSGIHEAAAGRVFFSGRDVTSASAATRVSLGIVQVPEGRQIFGPLTVEENLALGSHTRPTGEIAGGLEEVYELFPVLAERRAGAAGSLSGGEQQMLAIGRALMARPKLLLLDEPSLGLAPMMTSFIFDRIRGLNAQGITVLLVEQNATLALEMADQAYVLETGRVVGHGTGAALLRDQSIRAAYLGA